MSNSINLSDCGVPPAKLVIGIPTFRRPELLGKLLQSLLPELINHPAFVLVADNDCGKDAAAVVDAFRNDWPHCVCIPVPERGVAQVRNAIVKHAEEIAPNWCWLLMLDDDGLATPGWLGKLVEAGDRFDAHLVGGPVEGVLPASANLLAHHSIFASRRRWPTGEVSTLNTTQNLGISRSIFDIISSPLFRDAYGASGGEDYDLFRRTKQGGGKLVWCDEAVVIEPAPADRLSVRALLNRYATTGAYMAVIDSVYDGRAHTWRQALKGLVGALIESAIGLLTLKKPRFAKGMLASAHFLGRISGLFGVRTSRYISKQ